MGPVSSNAPYTGIPLDTAYSVEEREKQISLLRDLRLKRRQGQDLRPTSLVQAAREGTTLSKRYLKAMVEAQYQSPVISLYMSLGPEAVAPKEKAITRLFHSERTRALEERKAFVESLSRPQRETLTFDLKEIEIFLAEYFIPKEVRTLVIFKSDEELNRVFGLPVHVPNILAIDPDPLIAPLESVLEEQERVLFLEVTKEESRFAIYHFGRYQEVDRIKSFVPSDRVDKSVPGHAQQHRLTHLQWHLKTTAQHAYHLFADQECEVMVVLGEHRIQSLLDEYLHQTLKSKIISRIHGSPVADPRARKDLINQALRDHKARRETSAIKELGERQPDKLVFGLRKVIDALNFFLVRDLYVAERLRQKGLVCRQHHYIALEGTECPFDGAKLLPVENVIDEVVEIARLHGVKIMMIEHRQDLLSKYDGVVAVVYVQPAQGSAAA
jgi:hypothetical protein